MRRLERRFENPNFGEEELKRINCMQTLKSYLTKMFADERLEKLLFNGREEIELSGQKMLR